MVSLVTNIWRDRGRKRNLSINSAADKGGHLVFLVTNIWRDRERQRNLTLHCRTGW